MADRLTTLRRIGAVQAEMIKLAELRLATAERACRDLTEGRTRLSDYVAGQGDLGVVLAKAALTSLKDLDRRLAEAEGERIAQREKLNVLRRRDPALEAATRREAAATRRAEEARDLAETLDAWLAVAKRD